MEKSDAKWQKKTRICQENGQDKSLRVTGVPANFQPVLFQLIPSDIAPWRRQKKWFWSFVWNVWGFEISEFESRGVDCVGALVWSVPSM